MEGDYILGYQNAEDFWVDRLTESKTRCEELELEIIKLKNIIESKTPVAWVTADTAEFFGKTNGCGVFEYSKSKLIAIDGIDRDYNIPLYLGDNLGES